MGVRHEKPSIDTTHSKPPYEVPSMETIRAIPSNGLSNISFFSGAGGTCLGLKQAGFATLYASEFIPAARNTYSSNFPGVPIDDRDIREVHGKEVLDRVGLRVGEVDLVEGSPPCAAFSAAGKLEDGWNKVKKYSDTEQRVDDLFYEYARILGEIQPRAFVAENVTGLVRGVSKGYFKQIYKRLAEAGPGYRVLVKRVNALHLGAATSRDRVIFVALRRDLEQDPPFPKPLKHKYSFRDAMEGIEWDSPKTEWVKEGPFECWPMPPGQMQDMWTWCKSRGESYMWKSYEALYGKVAMYNHRLCLWDKPVPTMTQSSHCVYHFERPRSLNVREAKRVSTFPDDFELTDTFPRKWERIARAVPPIMMHKVGEAVAEVLKR